MKYRALDVGWYQRSFPGESICGDKTGAFASAEGCWLVLADGLGHGRKANEAAAKAVSIVEHVADLGTRLVDPPFGSPISTACVSLPALFSAINEHMRKTVGAAVCIAYVSQENGLVRSAGVGNALLRRIGSADTRMVCRDGIVGQLNQRRTGPMPVEFVLVPGDLLLLTSDGVINRFGTAEYPGLLSQPAATVARTVVENYSKTNDDACCLALRYTP